MKSEQEATRDRIKQDALDRERALRKASEGKGGPNIPGIHDYSDGGLYNLPRDRTQEDTTPN